MNRLDGQGHHPWIRPHNFHTKKARAKLKVIRQVLPKAQQIAMMKLGIGFVPTEGNCFVLGKLIEWFFLISSETTQEEPICVDMSCGEVGDYAMLDAVPSRPPPKHGWTYKVIQHTAVLCLAALMALATACKKDPNGTNNTNEPTREVVIDWDWDQCVGLAPSKEMIKNETDKPDVKTVFINFNEMNVTNLSPANFHRARDTLQTRIDINPTKVRGMGTLYVNSINGAHLPNCTEHDISGMSLVDSIWYTAHGWTVQRLHQFHNK